MGLEKHDPHHLRSGRHFARAHPPHGLRQGLRVRRAPSAHPAHLAPRGCVLARRGPALPCHRSRALPRSARLVGPGRAGRHRLADRHRDVLERREFGTLANVVLLVGVLYGFASRGPLSLRSEFEHALTNATLITSGELLTEKDLAPLPEPVQRYIRRSGAVGQPRVHDFLATWKGRIRSDPKSAWMAFTAEQLNTLDVPRRFFMMDATMKGLPVDVFHAFDEGGATMRVRLLAVVPMVDAKGAELTRAETVTIFNDLCFLAPGALVSPSIAWVPVDAHTVRARYRQGANTVGAELTINDAGELVDFGSDDRAAGSSDGRTFTPMRWTTPARDYTRVGPVRVATRAETLWHPTTGAWSYGEFELTSLHYNVGR